MQSRVDNFKIGVDKKGGLLSVGYFSFNHRIQCFFDLIFSPDIILIAKEKIGSICLSKKPVNSSHYSKMLLILEEGKTPKFLLPFFKNGKSGICRSVVAGDKREVLQGLSA